MMAAAPYFTKAALILDHLNFMLFTTLTMVAAHFQGALFQVIQCLIHLQLSTMVHASALVVGSCSTSAVKWKPVAWTQQPTATGAHLLHTNLASATTISLGAQTRWPQTTCRSRTRSAVHLIAGTLIMAAWYQLRPTMIPQRR